MRELLVIAAAGGLLGGGIAAAVRAAMVTAPPLARVAASLQQPVTAYTGGVSRVERLVARLFPGAVVRDDLVQRDLRAAGRTAAQQAVLKVGMAAVLATLPLLAVTVMTFAGVGVPPLAAVVPAIGMAALGWVVPDLEVRERAATRREEFVAALSAYLDVVAILLAGGSGTETALYAAAEQGGGWPFVALRGALDHSRLAGVAPWTSLRQLGVDLGVDELTELAASAAVAGRHGAQVRESLTARAAGLRATQLARAEEQAGATTEKMTVPLAVLGVSFLAFILFPAIAQVLAASQ